MTSGGVSMMVTASQVSFLWSSAEYQTCKSITFVPLQIYLNKPRE
jgi:hypothetical protein